MPGAYENARSKSRFLTRHIGRLGSEMGDLEERSARRLVGVATEEWVVLALVNRCPWAASAPYTTFLARADPRAAAQDHSWQNSSRRIVPVEPTLVESGARESQHSGIARCEGCESAICGPRRPLRALLSHRGGGKAGRQRGKGGRLGGRSTEDAVDIWGHHIGCGCSAYRGLGVAWIAPSSCNHSGYAPPELSCELSFRWCA